MVEVVQDLLDHLASAGGNSRRRVESVRGFAAGTSRPGASDFAVFKECADHPRGPQLRRMRDATFSELLDRPWAEKTYHRQMEEFASRGEEIIGQIDHSFGETQEMIFNDILKRSKLLPHLIEEINTALSRAHRLICGELSDALQLRFGEVFYPDESGWEHVEPAPTSLRNEGGKAEYDTAKLTTRLPGGWLDLDDGILTARLLIRHIAELIGLVGVAVQQLPEDLLARPPPKNVASHPTVRQLVASCNTRAPWLEVSVATDEDRTNSPSNPRPMLHEALKALDSVVTVHLKGMQSELHRTKYQAFFRMAYGYQRWKRMLKAERAQALALELARKKGRRASRANSSQFTNRKSTKPLKTSDLTRLGVVTETALLDSMAPKSSPRSQSAEDWLLQQTERSSAASSSLSLDLNEMS